jgi:hypothetical protein
MKKLIIALSVMAIASLSFNKVAMAEYRKKDLPAAKAYRDSLVKEGFPLDYKIVGFDEKLKFAKQVCADGSFDLAMTRFKKSHYPFFVTVVILLNTDRFEVYAYKQELKTHVAHYCRGQQIVYPDFFGDQI